MTAKEALKVYMRENGYSGLVCESGECGCEIDDMAPCGSDEILNCTLGHKVDSPPDDPSCETPWSIMAGPAPKEERCKECSVNCLCKGVSERGGA